MRSHVCAVLLLALAGQAVAQAARVDEVIVSPAGAVRSIEIGRAHV